MQGKASTSPAASATRPSCLSLTQCHPVPSTHFSPPSPHYSSYASHSQHPHPYLPPPPCLLSSTHHTTSSPYHKPSHRPCVASLHPHTCPIQPHSSQTPHSAPTSSTHYSTGKHNSYNTHHAHIPLAAAATSHHHNTLLTLTLTRCPPISDCTLPLC